MNDLKNNKTYQILVLQVAVYENRARFKEYLATYGYSEGLRAIDEEFKALHQKLDVLHLELLEKYDALALHSSNLPELEKLSTTLLLFKTMDTHLLVRVKTQIKELTAQLEVATKTYDFKTANVLRREIRQLHLYYTKNQQLIPDNL